MWTILYCSDPKGCFLHEDNLIKSNPNAQVLKIDFTNNFKKEIGWRQCDIIVRSWLKKNKDEIKHNNIAIIEYDVLITKELPDICLSNEILVKKPIDLIEDYDWVFFQENKRLGDLEKYACGILCFGFLMMSRNCIDYLVDDKYDCVFDYDKDIFCELRFPTVLNHNNVAIRKAPEYMMTNIELGMGEDWVSFDDIKFDINTPGFYHPVKNKHESNTNVK